MVIAKFDSSEYLTFDPPEIELKKVNFFYGKNGVGKSTISRLLSSQFSGEYVVKTFNGFSGVVGVNHSLDSISLGDRNVKAQQEIDRIEAQIQSISDEILEREGKENLYSQKVRIEQSLNSSQRNLDRIYTDSAREIKNLSHPQVASTTYKKTDFKKDIGRARYLSNAEFEQAKQECITDLMDAPDRLVFPVCDFEDIRVRADELLRASVSQHVQVSGIGENIEKRKFAEQGMRVHLRENGELCAFCGGVITEDRWNLLDQLFDKSVSELKRKIENLIKEVTVMKDSLNACDRIVSQSYYPPLREKVDTLQVRYIHEKEVLVDGLDRILSLLKNKADNIFSAVDVYEGEIPSWDTVSLQSKFDQIYKEKIEYGKNLEQKQKDAQERLRLHYVATMIEESNYSEEEANCRIYSSQLDDVEAKIKERREEIAELQEQRNSEISKTVNEELAARHINNALKSLGIDSFELRLIQQDGAPRGQYSIYSNEIRRDISSLSTGEMNLVSFLYFMQSLNENRVVDKPLFVIIDDPMNSNDSSAQYLMYSSIIRFYGDKKSSKCVMKDDDILVVLTHNAHFYLNCRPYGWKPNDKRIGCYRLNKIKQCTQIKAIRNKDDDIKTGYTALWYQLNFAYKNRVPDAMWNPLRQIIESFANFSGVKSLDELIGETEPGEINSVLLGELKKGMDVNSHGIDSIASDSESLSCEDIYNFARWSFVKVNYSSHFEKFSMH